MYALPEIVLHIFFRFQICHFFDDGWLLDSITISSIHFFLVAIYDCVLLRALLVFLEARLNKLVTVVTITLIFNEIKLNI